jgi:GT2 family glycosyltransferase
MEHERAATEPGIGVVVIGRNEGERLTLCLDSVFQADVTVVYVDSGSTDGSLENARSKGVEVVALDSSIPFTAARARNAGFKRLRELAPRSEYVQFVDGDCELIEGWLNVGRSHLQERPELACVCGTLRERYPERSVYNRLCDAEWNRPAGQTDYCGGIAMMRCAAVEALGGFREDMVAGEEPELCLRIRRNGGLIWRLPDAMAWHDADIVRFDQWWRRTKRGGFAYAHSLWLQGRRSERTALRRCASAWLWTLGPPLATIGGAFVWGFPALWLLLVYPANVLRLTLRLEGSWQARFERAAFLVIGRFPELLGQWQFITHRRRASRASPSFDYKS